ncbi:MAG TPA: SAM-dependent methyltransferase [Candidatus Eremiobacteraceae bacterium]
MNDPRVEGIRSIGDTARWVAYYRALETDRKDAIFRDPFARDLAGDVGKRMADLNRSAAWSMIVRTAVMDELILREVNLGCDAVLNLGAGLDTRPQRLALPGSLRWIEVDLPDMIAYKNEKLTAAPASCFVERIGLDLADLAARRELFARVNSRARRVLVLSEGLIVYLSEEQVAQLGRDLHEYPNFALWLFDQTSPAIVALITRRYHHGLAAANAPMQFAPQTGLAFHAAQGWLPREERDMVGEAHRLGREMPMARLLWAVGLLRARNVKLWSTMALMERAPV